MNKAFKLGLAKLLSSDLTSTDAKAFGIEILTATSTIKLFPKQKVSSLKFNYYDAGGAKRKDTFRIRLLEPPPPGRFGEVESKPIRYLQPHDSPPAAYLPRTVDWEEVFDDVETTILITEGELKAACACKHGFKCIGLGGVSSWKSKRLGWSMLPELEEVNWIGRDVVIVFDSDMQTNVAVRTAVAVLCKELRGRGASPRIAELPNVMADGKTGLDDFVVTMGPDALVEIIDDAPDDAMSNNLWEFNSRFVYVLNPGFVYDEQLNARYKSYEFVHYAFSNVSAYMTNDRGQLVLEKVAPMWIDWPLRRQVNEVTFAPEKPKFTETQQLNAWVGWGCEEEEGSIEPWQQLLDILFENATLEHRLWFERWCLYPIAFPGTKQLSAAGIWSREQGQGKSLIGTTLGKIYGIHYGAVSQRHLESQFNGWAVHKQLVMIDDVSAYDSRSKADIMKTMITQETMTVNIKGLPTYSVPDKCNFYLTSNRANAFYLEDKDRRFFIHEVKRPKAKMKFYGDYIKWLNGPGAPALLYYARHEMEFDDYDPNAAPPTTDAKQEMVDSVKSELGLWLTDLRTDPDGNLRMGKVVLKRDIYTPTELIAIFDLTRKGKPVTPNIMGLFLKDYFVPANDGRPVRIDGRAERLYIVRNTEKWKSAARVEIIDHISSLRPKENGNTKY